MLEADQEREPAERHHRLLERTEFDHLCDEVGGVSDKVALLDFLHHNGVVFYRPGLFGDRIVLDQNWALEAIYAIFDRKKILPLFRGKGRFSRVDLEVLIWSDYTPEEQKVFLGMMESCGICFRLRLLDGEWEYIAPELLPTWSEAQKSLLAGRIPKGQPMAEAEAIYPFLHEGVLRGYLPKIGQQAGDAAIYWKYGCWSYEATTDSRVLIEGRWDDAASEAGAGSIRLRAWGENAENLIDPFLEALQSLPIGQPPEIKRTKAIGAYATSLSSASATIRLVSAPPVAQSPDIVRQDGSKQADRPAQKTLQDLNFTKDPIMKDFFISYTKADQAWAEWIAWTLEGAGYSTVIQTWDFRPGTNFVLEMQRAATEANRTIAVLSQKYLDSTFTQPEWAAAFAQDPQGKKQKLIPVRIAACELTGILAPIVYLDLVGLPEDDARTALLGAFSIRNKPASAPAFPGVPSTIASPPQPAYPGTTDTTSAPIAEILSTVAEDTDQSRPFSASQRLQFMRQLNEIVPQHFNMLLFAVNPPAGLIPPMPAPQGDRTSALLTWAEAPGGCGLSVLEELLDTIVSPSPFGTGEQPNRNAPAVPISSDISISALGPQRLTVPEKSAAEIIRNLKESTPSYEFHKRAKELYLGRWPQEPGWQATVHDLPRNLSGGLWHCSFREVGSGTLVMASTIQDISALRPGYLVTVSGRISDVSPLESVSLEDAIIRGDHVPS